MKVLVVDDEPSVRRSLRRALELRNHAVEEAENGEQAVELWRRWQPQAVLLDILMPGLSGPAVLKEIGPTPAKVILMSAYSGDYDVEKARSMGAEHFIAKPFADIFAVIDRIEGLVREG